MGPVANVLNEVIADAGGAVLASKAGAAVHAKVPTFSSFGKGLKQLIVDGDLRGYSYEEGDKRGSATISRVAPVSAHKPNKDRSTPSPPAASRASAKPSAHAAPVSSFYDQAAPLDSAPRASPPPATFAPAVTVELPDFATKLWVERCGVKLLHEAVRLARGDDKAPCPFKTTTMSTPGQSSLQLSGAPSPVLRVAEAETHRLVDLLGRHRSGVLAGVKATDAKAALERLGADTFAKDAVLIFAPNNAKFDTDAVEVLGIDAAGVKRAEALFKEALRGVTKTRTVVKLGNPDKARFALRFKDQLAKEAQARFEMALTVDVDAADECSVTLEGLTANTARSAEWLRSEFAEMQAARVPVEGLDRSPGLLLGLLDALTRLKPPGRDASGEPSAVAAEVIAVDHDGLDIAHAVANGKRPRVNGFARLEVLPRERALFNKNFIKQSAVRT